MQKKVVVIAGPTASGKTGLGICLARALNGEVVGADAMQIYKKMDIGTAKPTAEERGEIPHHMIDIVPPTEDYSVSRYVRDAAACIDDILSRGKLPILVGGTGLYIDSLLSGRDFAENDSSGELREELNRRYEEEGGEKLLQELRSVDPESGGRLHANDKKRIVRALEVYRLTGKTITQHNEESKMLPPRYETGMICLNFTKREDLCARIDRRVDMMMDMGLRQETEKLLAEGLSPTCTAFQAIGYKESVATVLSGGSWEEAAELIKLRSRQYAKRQLSWFRREKDAHWICWEKEPDSCRGLQDSTEFLRKIGII